MVGTAARLFVTGKATTETQAFNMANKLMPEGRIRMRADGGNFYPNQFAEWKARWGDLIKSIQELPTPLLTVDPAPVVVVPAPKAAAKRKQVVVPAPVSEPVSETPAEIAPEIPAQTPSLGDLIGQVLVAALCEALESPRGQAELRNAFTIPAGVADEEHTIKVPGIATLKTPVLMRKKSVLIVGLLGDQQREIASTYRQVFDMRFLGSDSSAIRMKEHSSNVDLAIGMVSYMSHPCDKILNKHAKDYKRINGTVS
jgi:hypothetical protein